MLEVASRTDAYKTLTIGMIKKCARCRPNFLGIDPSARIAKGT